ncbi:MAG: hypothetical protein QG597_4826 [Actinomycetota bacterium]|nr:hypothetical protein [Actinomycetota bacterium]
MAGLTDASVRQLEALVAVSEHGTFGAAAAHLGFSQAAVSQQIAALERAAGQRLFVRLPGPRRVTLTQAGRLLLEHAQTVLTTLGLAERQLQELACGQRGQLRVGTFQSISVKVLPAVVTKLRALRPELEVVLFETEDNADLLDRAASGAVDITFAAGPIWDDRLEVVRLGLDPYVAMVAVDHPLAGSAVFPLHDLDRAPTIGLEGGTVCQMVIESSLQVSGVRPNYVFRSNDNGAVQAMVAAGVGTAVMPRLTINQADQAVRVLPLEPPIPPREICLAYSRSQPLPRVAADFIELARGAVRQQGVLPPPDTGLPTTPQAVSVPGAG